MSKLCIFIASSDNTVDVLSQTLKSYQKYWQMSKFDRFVGLNSNNNDINNTLTNLDINIVYAKKPLGWHGELKEQLSQLNQQYDYVLLILDDFFIQETVNEKHISEAFSYTKSLNADYLRLIPKKGSIWFLWYQNLIKKFTNSSVSRLYPFSPYYSSLQMAIWRIDYLLECLDCCSDIWDFEHKTPKNSKHYTIRNRVINYRHIVEKGRWFDSVPDLFKQHKLDFTQGSRGMYQTSLGLSPFKVYKMRLFGYIFMIIRKKIN